MKKDKANLLKSITEKRDGLNSRKEVVRLAVGKSYPFPLAQEGAATNFLLKEGNILQFSIPNITPRETKAFKEGVIKAGLLNKNGSILWVFVIHDKKGKPVFSLDAPFDARLIPSDQIALHDITNNRQRLAIDVHVVSNGVVKALRMITMSPKLTLSFLSAVQDQLAAPQDDSALREWMNYDPEQLSKQVKLEVLGKQDKPSKIIMELDQGLKACFVKQSQKGNKKLNDWIIEQCVKALDDDIKY